MIPIKRNDWSMGVFTCSILASIVTIFVSIVVMLTSIEPILVSITTILLSIDTILASIEQVNTPYLFYWCTNIVNICFRESSVQKLWEQKMCIVSLRRKNRNLFLRRRRENQKERKKVKLCEIARLNVVATHSKLLTNLRRVALFFRKLNFH